MVTAAEYVAGVLNERLGATEQSVYVIPAIDIVMIAGPHATIGMTIKEACALFAVGLPEGMK